MRSPILLPLLILLAGAGWALDRRVSLIDESRILPSEHPAIGYWEAEPDDAIARLQQRLEAGQTRLAFHEELGYLPAVLEELDVAQSSQVLVFSKTSFQAARIYPRAPRAIYHNEDVSVGWVRGGDVVEIASVDPKLGVVFYTLDQMRTPRPRFRLRTTECISCHVGPASSGVPGLVVRSVHPDSSGTPERAPSFITDHRSPLSERWGGWYVSGLHGSQTHLGNVTFQRGRVSITLSGDRADNIENLRRYISPYQYLRTTSDIVSLMTLEHQTRMTNLITRLGYETRMALHDHPEARELDAFPAETATNIRNAAEELLRYMLFTDEAPLEEPVQGSSGFAEAFEARGRRDSKGRSLHQLDLQTRLLRYPCSYLIESEAFEALPEPAKGLVYRRLWDVLHGRGEAGVYGSLSAEDRRAILEILLETKPDLPDYWRS